MDKYAGHIGAIIVVTLWGTTFVSSKVLLNSGLMPADIFLLRFMMAYVCMAALSHKRLWSESIKDELTFLGLGIMGGSLYFLTENMALIHSTTSNVSILVSTTPLLTLLIISLFFRSERMSGRQIAGSIVAFVGVVLVVLNGQLILHLNPKGDMLALAASLTWALYSLFMRMLMGRYSTDFITRKVFGYGILTIIPYMVFIKPFSADFHSFDSIILSNLLFLGLIASTGGYLLWNWVMKRLGAVKATNYIYFQPLVTAIAGFLLLGERITPMGACGGTIIIIGMVGALKARQSNG